MTVQRSTLNLLASEMHLEPAEETGCPKLDAQPTHSDAGELPGAVHHAVMPGGKHIRLLKTLLTSACERNCFYCPFRVGRDYRRETLKPDEMAQAFMAYQQAGLAEGLFLSSGLAGGGIRTQDRLIDTAEILRTKYQFQGYLHLKIMPGAEQAQVERIMQLADRVSINLEAPNTQRLQMLAPRKVFLDELLQPMRWVEEIRRSTTGYSGWKHRWPSLATQFVVGAVGESDLELLKTTDYLHRQLRLSRAYFSAFRPITDTPLENLPAESPLRQLRLYQASFLLRDYGFRVDELPLDSGDNLPLLTDPKLFWARQHLAELPLELNQATQDQLLRVPGIGLVGAKAILKARRTGQLKRIEDLKRIGIQPARAAPFILLDGQRPTQQLRLW